MSCFTRLVTCSSYFARSPKFSFAKSNAARLGEDRTEGDVVAAAATAAAVAAEEAAATAGNNGLALIEAGGREEKPSVEEEEDRASRRFSEEEDVGRRSEVDEVPAFGVARLVEEAVFSEATLVMPLLHRPMPDSEVDSSTPSIDASSLNNEVEEGSATTGVWADELAPLSHADAERLG